MIFAIAQLPAYPAHRRIFAADAIQVCKALEIFQRRSRELQSAVANGSFTKSLHADGQLAMPSLHP
jgi:hypothetical protein